MRVIMDLQTNLRTRSRDENKEDNLLIGMSFMKTQSFG